MKTFNKWRRAAIAALAGSVAIGVGTAAFAHGKEGWYQDERIESPVKSMLKRVDATEEQQVKVTDIAKKAAADLRGLRTRQGDLRKRGVELLAASTVDRAAIESLRVDQIWLADEASKRMSVALADTAEVLTPEQRAKLAERLKQHGGHRHRG